MKITPTEAKPKNLSHKHGTKKINGNGNLILDLNHTVTDISSFRAFIDSF